MKSGWRALFAGMSLLMVAACSHNSPAVSESVVVKKSTAAKSAAATLPKPAAGQQHTVGKGDTLYSIAFRYGVDFKTLAALNGIRDPYTIYPGQVLTIKSRGQPLAAKPTVKAAANPDVKSGVKPREESIAASRPNPPPPKPESKPESAAPMVSAPKPAAVPPAAVVEKSGPAGPVATRHVGGGNWQWPVQGRLLAKFSNSGVGPKGIAVGGDHGDPVRAARDGRVVYTGSSLVGYGQLVIVKHDEVYLSAYAHNSKVLVKEGESVKAGQKIAEMGSTGTDRTKLHFEVRRNGDPVDPLSVLPLI